MMVPYTATDLLGAMRRSLGPPASPSPRRGRPLPATQRSGAIGPRIDEERRRAVPRGLAAVRAAARRVGAGGLGLHRFPGPG